MSPRDEDDVWLQPRERSHDSPAGNLAPQDVTEMGIG